MASTAGAPPILPAGSFPRAPLWGALGLVVLALLLALTGRLTGSTVIPTGVAPAAARDLRFLDRDDGGIDVIDAANGHRIETVTGQSGFLRGTVRGLASQRKRAGLSRDEPFRLTAWRDGRLTLDDPTDARHVELEAFGPSNEGVFAEILAHPEALAPTSKPAP